MIRFYRVTIKDAQTVADDFITNGHYCGAMDGKVLQYKKSLKVFDGEPLTITRAANTKHTNLLLPGDRTAALLYPFGLTEKDIDAMHQQIDGLRANFHTK